MSKIQEILEAHKTENGYNLEAIEKDLNTKVVDDILARKKESYLEEVKPQFQKEFETSYFKNLGIDNVETYDQFKTYAHSISGSVDEKDKALLKAQSDLEELRKTHEVLNNDYSTLQFNNKLDKVKNTGLFNDNLIAESFVNVLEKQVTEEKDFTTLLNEYVESKGEKQETKKAGLITKQKKPNYNPGDPELDEWRKQAGLI